MKTAQLLQTLNDQLSELAALVAPLAEHATLSPRFDRQLFHTRSTLMQAYLAEAQHNFNQLRQAVERQQLPQVVWIAERLAAQIAALRRETATWSLRSWDHASPTLSRWQRRRLQHQEYERRLLAMRDQRQRQQVRRQCRQEHRAGNTGGGDRYPHQIGTDFTCARIVWL